MLTVIVTSTSFFDFSFLKLEFLVLRIIVLDEARTGLFTYFLAMGLRGKADLNEDGHVTAGELYRYIYSNVSENSKKIYQEQIPCFYGDDSFILY